MIMSALFSLSAALSLLMPPVLLAAGVYFGFKLRFFYIIHPIKTIRLMFSRSSGGMSPIRAASIALAGTLGVGNITGVTAAISAGGAGAVFWMWISALCAMSVKYAETALAVVYRRRDAKEAGGGYYGGAPYYISDGLRIGARGAACAGAFFAVLCIINSLTVGNILQANAAAISVSELTGLPRYAVGIITAAMTALIVSGGAKRISSFTVRLIPAASLLYIIMCLAVIANGIELLPDVFENIMREAFSFRPAVSGAGGYMIAQAIRYGVTRGVLTNEAGSGTSPAAHACAETESPASQGALGIFEVFADTILICTLTAFAVLIAFDGDFPSGADAMSISEAAFESALGRWSEVLLCAVILVFVFATLIAQYYYGESALRFLSARKGARHIYTAAFGICVFAGSVITPQLMWLFTDITVALMTTVNVICLIFMRGQIMKYATPDFQSR